MTKAEKAALEALVAWAKLDREILTSRHVLPDDSFDRLMEREDAMRRAAWSLPTRWVDEVQG